VGLEYVAKWCPKLGYLAAQNATITDEGIKFLAASKICTLRLQNSTGITNKSVDYLSGRMSLSVSDPFIECEQLMELWIQSSQINDEGLLRLVKAHPQIKTLYVNHAVVSNAGIAAVKNVSPTISIL
jgi:hypothetical protein